MLLLLLLLLFFDVVGFDTSSAAVADIEETVAGTVAITIHAADAVVAIVGIGIAAASTGIASAYIDASTVSVFFVDTVEVSIIPSVVEVATIDAASIVTS